MDQFCGSRFWNRSLLWDVQYNPDLTLCFEETVLVWIPCSLLFLFSIIPVISLIFQKLYNGGDSRKKRSKEIPLTTFNLLKLLLCLAIAALSLIELGAILLAARPFSSSVYWITPLVKTVTFVYVAYMIHLYRKCGVYSSALLFLFTLFYTVYSVASFRTIVLATFDNGIFYPEYSDMFLISRTFGLAFIFAQLLLQCFNEYSPTSNLDPHQRASFMNRLTFWWFTETIVKGYKRPLVEQDCYQMIPENSTKNILRTFEEKMKNIRDEKIIHQIEQEANGSESYQRPESDRHNVDINIAFVIFRIYWREIIFIATLKLIASCLTFGNPLVLDKLITFMSSKDPNLPVWHGYFFAALMFIFPMFESMFNGQYEYYINILSLQVRTCLTSLIYNKALKLSTYGRKDYSTGEVVNIMSVDTQKLIDFLGYVNMIWSAPLQLVIATFLLWNQVNWAAIAGISFLFLMIPMNVYISAKIRNNQIKVMREKDKRTKLMNEILNGMKVLKLYAWENSFRSMIEGFRNSECDQLYTNAYLSGSMFFAFAAAPFLVGLITFMTYVLMGNVLDPNKAFVSLSLINLIRVPMGIFPMLLSMGAMSIVSIKRLNKYLNAEELDEYAIRSIPDQECAIRIKRCNFTWNRAGESTLKNINLEVPHGKLIALVGRVGSGKSSLLSGILGDMEKQSGTINVDGRLALVPQQAWIQNATLRKNITFTSPFEEKKYKKIIKACCLLPDIKMLQEGDQTEIGERGINVSGGQKQRISLARAVYSDATIYLLDDPLSAVDSHVGKALFENVISNRGLLQNKTRILATHRISVLEECDEILVMSDDGTISERGTMKELLDQKGNFSEYIAEYIAEVGEDVDNEESELIKSLAEKVRPILERTLSRQASESQSSQQFSRTNSLNQSGRSSLRQRKVSRLEASVRESSRPVIPKKAPTKLIQDEKSETGAVKWKVYTKYLGTVGFWLVTSIVVGMIFSNGFQMAGGLWLSAWSNDGLNPTLANDTYLRDTRLIGYAGFGFGEILTSLSATIVLQIACIKASKALHNEMLRSIMASPMDFFDTTPIGRILNRFTKDIDIADSSLAFNLRMTFMQFFRMITAFIMISLEAPIILAVMAPLVFFYIFIQRVYINTSRQLKRIESTTRSPIYNHFSETVNGTSSIRAYGVQEYFVADSNKRIDINNTCFYSSFTAGRWLSIRLEFFGYMIVFISALFAVINRETLSPGLAGLAISYSLSLTLILSMLVRSATDTETNIVSVERLIDYTEMKSEKQFCQENCPNPSSWPKDGVIKFEDYSTRYREGLELVLRNVSFQIDSNEKVGIVGRTGAGKSSLTLALFRIIEPATGRIVIDGIDVSELGLFDLRSRLTIIPQDPVLFTGTLRMNLDPFNNFTDTDIWNVLTLAHLKEFVQKVDNGLLYKVTEGGENLSVGQRQLVCLARALLRKTKILVLDEATAAVDVETDKLIQETIQKEFQTCTIVTIAHRLNTIMDYDRILVLDQGKIAEYDTPANLLANKNSVFYSMAKDAKLVEDKIALADME